MNHKRYQRPADAFFSPLKEHLAAYVDYKVNINGCRADTFLLKLRQFDKHCVAALKVDDCLTREAIMGYLTLREGESRSNLYCRAVNLRGFLEYMSRIQKAETVYLLKTPCKRNGTYVPYIFSRREVSDILDAAEEYRKMKAPPRSPNLPNAMLCIIALLYCTGMRISEILDLAVDDVNLKSQTIQVNHAKNDNRRIVTITETLKESIERYSRHSTSQVESPFFFYSGSELHKGHISIKTAYAYFRRYLEMAGIAHQGRGKGPRMHDFRATFAVHSLQMLSKMPGDIQSHLAVLSTYSPIEK